MSKHEHKAGGAAVSNRDKLQFIGKMLTRELEPGTGFFLLTFTHGDNSKPAQYISNSVRDDVVKAMQEFLDRQPMQQQKDN